jgi:hypothetical protein
MLELITISCTTIVRGSDHDAGQNGMKSIRTTVICVGGLTSCSGTCGGAIAPGGMFGG